MFLGTMCSMQASRALSEPFTVSQPDGKTLTIKLYGDEQLSWLTTSDNILVVETPKGYFVAAVAADGHLVASPYLAHQPAARPAEEQLACRQQQQRRSLFFDRVGRTWDTARRAQVTGQSYFPHMGSPKCLVILVNFQDVKFQSDDPYAQFDQYLNGEVQLDLGHNEQKNVTSVRRYFELSSHGLFTPQFDLVGPVTLPQTLEYYGADSGDNKDVHFNDFCKDAIAAVDTLVDFRQYDNTGDGRAELVCIVFAGYGQNVSGNASNTIWAKCGYRGIATDDGVSVGFLNCSAELFRVSTGTNINGHGVFCHEFSHGMGLPDLYVTISSAQVNNQSPEFFDLMDYGEYAKNGYAPVPYSAWEQEAMGWIEIKQLTEARDSIVLKPLIQGGKAYKFGNGANSEEWMMIENVQPYDLAHHIPGFPYGHGLLVWHIAYASSQVTMGDYPNNTANHPRVSVVPASGQLINGYLFGPGQPYSQAEYLESLRAAPFPGTCGVTMLSAEQQLPNYLFYNGDESPVFKLFRIAEDSLGVVTFSFDDGLGTALPAVRDVASDAVSRAYYSLDGRLVGYDPRQLHSGLYIRNGKKVVLK